MRAVERAPWTERRSSRHDEMCLAIAKEAGLLFHGFTGEVAVKIEAPCGAGFADLIVRTIAPFGEVQAALVEVKTNDENCSGGDIIRQIRWYRKNFPFEQQEMAANMQPRLVLVLEDQSSLAPRQIELVSFAGIEVLPIRILDAES